ncbi:MAG: hypothetical protein HUU21_00635 [Polyangiaceae bacterium]|nr:hypothetical protein [Polyangiaceae bacterium]
MRRGAQSDSAAGKIYGATAARSAGPRYVRVWRSDGLAPVPHKFEAQLILSRDLLGRHATADPTQAPLLKWTSAEARVEVRKKDRFVFGIPCRSFDDLPWHAGAFGRYWTWVAHPDLDQVLVLTPKQPPYEPLNNEGSLHLYRLHVRPIRGDAARPLRISTPCIVVAGLGAVELAGSEGSTSLTGPEPVAVLNRVEVRRRLQHLPTATTRLVVPCVVPNSSRWLTDEAQVTAHLTSTLGMAYKKDPPDSLLLPCYLASSAPGIIIARRNQEGWTFTSTDTTINGGMEADHVRRTDPFEFLHNEHAVYFENKVILQAARDIILKGEDYWPEGKRRRPATIGAWRRAACVYALKLCGVSSRDLREHGWSDGMARCVEDFADDLGADAREWLRRRDGPRTFADQFTVRTRGELVANATEALAAMLDALVRPHGRTRINR